MAIRGGGDLATGAARKLHLAGFRVVISERAEPWCVRRRTSFASAVHEGTVQVEGVRARLVELAGLAQGLPEGEVAVVVCPEQPTPPGIIPDLLVDARVLKRGHDTRIEHAPRVIGVGPGFRVGKHCHAAVETCRGFHLGRVLYEGETRVFDGLPGQVGGAGDARVLRTATAGTFHGAAVIGDGIQRGDGIGDVDGQQILARIDGILRGLIADGTAVRAQQKVGDVDPRGQRSYCECVSDKANAVGGGVLEAALFLLRR